MSMIKEVTALFKDGAAKLPPINGKTTDYELERLQEILRNLLEPVKLPGGTYAKGLITTKANYQAAHAGATFDRLDMPLETYDPSIASDATMTDCMRAKCEWTAKILQQRLLQASERGTRENILGVPQNKGGTV